MEEQRAAGLGERDVAQLDDDDTPNNAQVIHEFTAPGRSQSFRFITSCNIALSRGRSTTKRLSQGFLFIQHFQPLHP